jgi:hypothetical protein
MPVCKKCHNYVTGKLESGHPCPHCGNEDTLTDRSTSDRKFIIPPEIQHDFRQNTYDNKQNYSQTRPNSPPIRMSTDLPLESIFPPSLTNSYLPVTEQRLYLQLSIEFRIILDRASSYQEGVRNWTLILPERLQEYGLNREIWDRIASLGDQDPNLQEQLKILVTKIFGL